MDWSLEQLSAHAQAALSQAPVGPLNGQIAELPNARTIRYYTTIGLLDRPRQAGDSRRDRPFWGAAPADVSPAPAAAHTPARPVTGIALADGVTLTFPC